MSKPKSPERWAFDLTLLLNAACGADRFPVDLRTLALDYTRQRFPGDAITHILGADLPGFDGALYRAPSGKQGWVIIHNDKIQSRGRINFTLAHELGHYLLHRSDHPNGMRCGEHDVVRWDETYARVEQEANVFAANLLMPLDDFRRQVPAQARVDLDIISHCAKRYDVSLIAATLRWLSYTEKRAVLVVSRDGFILWSRASAAALKTKAYFKTSGSPIEIPEMSLVYRQNSSLNTRTGVEHGPGVWFHEPTWEMTLFSEQYDFAVTLLLLEDHQPVGAELDAVAEPDLYDRLTTEPDREP